MRYNYGCPFIYASGAGEGELQSPMDVSLYNTGDELILFVLDAGNNRIQVVNSLGTYIAEFDGTGTPQGKLNNPLNMIGAPNLIVTDAGNNSVRRFSYSDNGQSIGIEHDEVLSLNAMGKVTETQKGLLLPDNTNQQLISVYTDGEILESLPMNQTSSIAMLYEQSHQLLYQESNNNSVKHLYIPKTVPSASPTALAQKFVQAYLNNDDKTILEFASSSLLKRLKVASIDVKAREAFANISGYQENIYMYGLKAEVKGQAQVSTGNITLSFNFVWQKGRWLLEGVM